MVRRPTGTASPQAVIVFRGAFDGATFRKAREDLRTLTIMRVAGGAAISLADFGRAHPLHRAATAQNKGQRCGCILHGRLSRSLIAWLRSARPSGIELCTTHTLESTIAAAATTGRNRP